MWGHCFGKFSGADVFAGFGGYGGHGDSLDSAGGDVLEAC